MKWLKRHISTILCTLIFLAGAALLAYPQFSNWWNQQHQSRAIATYQDAIESNDAETNAALLAAAEQYNTDLLAQSQAGQVTINALTDEQIETYNAVLDATGTGIMGYVKIPKIDVELPIYHGTDEAVLQIAVGHIEGTSLPVGGKGTHTVLSGHRGLPSARLFTDIDSLGIGDVFMITCVGRKITYEVDQILTVLPEETEALEIDPDQDYCTLVTCTPYGINSHRLLVRGHRIENLLDEDVETIAVEIPERELSQQERIQQMLPYVLIFAAGFFGLALLMPSKRRGDREETGETRRGRGRGRRDAEPSDARAGARRNARGRREQEPERYGARRGPDRGRWDDDDAYYEEPQEPEFYDEDEESWDDNGLHEYSYDDDEFYDDEE